MPYTYEYPRPMVTVDVVAVRPASGGHEVLLVRRGGEPFRGLWALPGGFVEMDEDLPDAAVRELREETGLAAGTGDLVEVGAFGKPGRDPRGRTIGIAYALLASAAKGDLRAGDDAAEAAWFPARDLPPLAFDHAEIVAAGLARLGVPGPS